MGTPKTYTITFQGRLDESWQNWFMDFRFSRQKDVYGNILTSMTGTVIDQAALRGVLYKIWDLNLTLISIQQIEPEIRVEKES
jgi:hypothetical protein